MDKQEYKLKAEEIKSLIAKRDFFKAVKIADEIDWKRVRSVAMLCTVSDLYKVNRRYRESKELLLMAYERNPNGRMIVYSLCELCIKMGEVVQAIEYYKEFVQLAPMDNGKYVLQYKLYVAQDVSLEERIAVLEELKKRDYREKWGYELAYLYHRIGLSTKCVEECDELILWFSDGRYVKKAMELKMLHQPLTPAQEASYNSFIGKNAELPKAQPVVEKPIEEQIQVQPMNVGKYDTINLQKALAESMKEVLSPVVSDPVKEEPQKPEGLGEVTGQIMAPMFRNTDNMKEIYFEDKTGEMPATPIQLKNVESVAEPKVEEVAEVTESKAEEVAEVTEPKAEEVAEVTEPKAEKVAEVTEPKTEEVAEVTEPKAEEVVEVTEPKAEKVAEAATEMSEEVIPAMAKAKIVVENNLEETTKAVEELIQEEVVAEKESEAQEKVVAEEAAEAQEEVIAEEKPEAQEEVIAEEAAEVQEEAVEEEPEEQEEAVAEEEPEAQEEVVEEEPEAQEEVIAEEAAEVQEEVVEVQEEVVAEKEPEIQEEIVTEEPQVQKIDRPVVNVAKEVAEPRKIEISTRGNVYEVPDDATKEIPSIREIMSRPLVERPVEVRQVVVSNPQPAVEVPTAMAGMLSQEYDGQISLVVDESTKIEKQITGQMNIEDVLIEWEKTKKQYEEKRTAERTQKVLEQTGSMFTEFEARIRDGILEQLQKEEQLEEEIKNSLLASNKRESLLDKTGDFGVEDIILAQMAQEEEEESAVKEEVAIDFTEREEEIEATEEKEESQTPEIKEEENSEESLEEEDFDEETPEEETLKKVRQAQEELRELSEEEKNLFSPFIQTKGARRRFMKALDMISLAAYTGNVIVTGEADSDTVKLAKNIMKNIQMTDSNFSGVIAKVSGSSLNSKSIEGTISKLNNGGLIIEKASGMNSQAVAKLLKALDQEQTGIVVIMEDTKKAIKRMLAAYPSMKSFFNAYIEIEELNNDALASYGRQYAAHLEYSIDELGMLALQTLIEDRQTSDHIVTVAEVRELVDDAIYSANRKTLGHFFDIIFGRRYDEEDMIILREKDFM